MMIESRQMHFLSSELFLCKQIIFYDKDMSRELATINGRSDTKDSTSCNMSIVLL